MREIKFRAWWNDTGKKVEDFNNEYIIDACNDEVFTVEQFTGLRDKNRKEIYEGDICRVVRWKDTEDESFIIGEIFEEKASFHIKNGYAICSTDLIGQIKPDIIEVIGNIHENPELLEVTK